MIRFLIIGGLLYWGYRKLQQLVSGDRQARGPAPPKHAADVVADIMVLDPQCEAYFPRQNGVSLVWKGQSLLFCSTKCRDAFISQHSNPTYHKDGDS